jgi:hypothetical protein
MDTQQLEKINKFTRRELTEGEIYTFSVILCDNDIDRDGERFSDEALETLKTLFVGRTGIFDHDAKSSNQSARIYDTELVTDDMRITAYGESYKYLRAYVYMVKTDENRSLIAEIDGGIKKEVSISCSASLRKCSVCGAEKSTSPCTHIKGKMYGGKICHTVLDGITDAYEWSFVAVPAQRNAGVTKKFTSECNKYSSETIQHDIEAANRELRRDIRRLAFFSGGTAAADNISAAAEFMGTNQLIKMKKSLESDRKSSNNGIEVQLYKESKNDCSADEFSMK